MHLFNGHYSRAAWVSWYQNEFVYYKHAVLHVYCPETYFV